MESTRGIEATGEVLEICCRCTEVTAGLKVGPRLLVRRLATFVVK